jgi:glycosyltransferase involved in cell wall biosynthesis
LLFPIDWPEPVGLVLIEAMACGTPVIAWRRGAVEEIVDDGVTGFIVANEDDAVAAISGLAKIDRQAVRRTFEQRFTARTMAHNYLELYRRTLKIGRQNRMAEIAHNRHRPSGPIVPARSDDPGSQQFLTTDAS